MNTDRFEKLGHGVIDALIGSDGEKLDIKEIVNVFSGILAAVFIASKTELDERHQTYNNIRITTEMLYAASVEYAVMDNSKPISEE